MKFSSELLFLDEPKDVANSRPIPWPKAEFFEVLKARRSHRVFTSAPIDPHILQWFLESTLKVSNSVSLPDGSLLTKRPHPSCGARHPLSVAVIQNLAWSFFDPFTGELSPAAFPKNKNVNATLNFRLQEAVFPRLKNIPPVVLIIYADYKKTEVQYGDRTYGHVMKDVGALHQTFYLAAQGLGLGGCAVGFENIFELEFAHLQEFKQNPEQKVVGGFILGNPPKKGESK